MSSIVGAKAISLASTPGTVEERPHARVFTVKGTGDRSYTVVLGAGPLRDVCTCPAGTAGRPCSHTAAARLVVGRELRAAMDARRTVSEYHADRFRAMLADAMLADAIASEPEPAA
jgi:uncharacterized Zn finger protein